MNSSNIIKSKQPLDKIKSDVLSRNPYVVKLTEFHEFCFYDKSLTAHKGTWKSFFLGKMKKDPMKIILEIGCNNGNFLNSIAGRNPQTAFIGMDWKYKLIYKSCEKSKKNELSNTAFLRADAQKLTEVFDAGELDEIWLFFPDPWPKKKQQKNRLFQKDFLLNVSKALKKNGRLYVKTDHPGYFQWMLSLLGQKAELKEDYLQRSEASLEKNKITRQRAHRTYENTELPLPIEGVEKIFQLRQVSTDFWNQVQDELLFSEEPTHFEKLFKRENLPVYFLELVKTH